MNALLTGAGGALGQSLCRLLVQQGWRVVALHRNPDWADPLRSLGATPLQADLESPLSTNNLDTSDAVVIHAAARVEQRGRWPEFERGTVHTTRNLLSAILPQRPQRVVYVSSGSVYPPTLAGTPVSADRTPAGPPHWNLYARAKLAAEELTRSACDAAGVPWSILRLGFLYGAMGAGPDDLWRRALRRGLLRIIGDGSNRIATLHVDDAAEAVRLATFAPIVPGRIYDVASDEPVTQAEWLAAHAQQLGHPAPQRRISRFVARSAAALFEGLMLRLRPNARHWRSMVELMSADQRVDCAAIRDELGWRAQRSFADWAAAVARDSAVRTSAARENAAPP